MNKSILPVNQPTAHYRHEYKYIVTEQQLAILQSRLRAIMPLDEHVNKTGRYAGIYNIRSLYFDDISNSCFYENENGTDPREKFRIRIYNHSTERISLELKQKVNGKCRKLSCRLTEEQCRELMNGKVLPFSNGLHPLLNKMLLQMRTRQLRPSVIVEYDRIPYVYKIGSVRVTMDMNIRSSDRVTDFMEDEVPMRPIMEASQHILEVKWDELLPDFINHSLALNNLEWTAFSKYYLCRRYSPGKTAAQFKHTI